MSESIDEFAVPTRQSRDALTEKQLVDYRSHRESFIRWLVHLGKGPKMAEGYSRDTVRVTAHRTRTGSTDGSGRKRTATR